MPHDDSVSQVSPDGDNVEWELADFVDAIAASIDAAEDTLSLKSFARGISFAIKQLSLDLGVSVRRAPDGRIFFRTVDTTGPTPPTQLKLDFAQVLESQLHGVRRDLEQPADLRPLTALSGITPDEIAKLNSIAIYSVDDLERYTQTLTMLSAVARKTGLGEARLRMWRDLPYLGTVTPASGPPGSSVLLEGGNLGLANGSAWFNGEAVDVIAWSPTRVELRMPMISGSGALYLIVGNTATNILEWEALTIDLAVRGLAASPQRVLEGDTITLQADLANLGRASAPSFNVRWTVANYSDSIQPHGPLGPGERSNETATRREIALPRGMWTVRFEADPEQDIADANRDNNVFSLELAVAAVHELAIGAVGPSLASLDPLCLPLWDGIELFGLVFRGLVQPDPTAGTLEGDLATSWEEVAHDGNPALTIRLRDNVRFHDSTLLSSSDVVFSYSVALKGTSPVSELLRSAVSDVMAIDDATVRLVLQQPLAQTPINAFALGIVPAARYAADPDGFGRQPVGTGPFYVDRWSPDGLIVRSFTGYMLGTPRLDRLTVRRFKTAGELVAALNAHDVDVAVLPYDRDVAARLRSAGQWRVQPLPDEAQPTLLDVQSLSVRERLASMRNSAWNAHLWYTRVGLAQLRRSDDRLLDGSSLEPGQTLEAYVLLTGRAAEPLAASVSASDGLTIAPSAACDPGDTRTATFNITAAPDASGAKRVTALLGPDELSATIHVQHLAGGARLYALLTSSFSADPYGALPQCAIEIIDTSNMQRASTFSIGQRSVLALAATTTGERLFVLEPDHLLTFTGAGDLQGDVKLPRARDLTISPDDRTIWITADGAVLALDTSTGEQRRIPISIAAPLGIAISRDGLTIATCGSANGTAALVLIDTRSLTARSVPISNPGEPTNCWTSPNDVVFTDTGKVLLWDSNCDNLYQVDVSTGTQLTAETIRTGRDEASSFNFNDVLVYSVDTRKAFALKESRKVAVLDPEKRGFKLIDVKGLPFVPKLAVDGRQLFVSVVHRFDGGGADTLDIYSSDGTLINTGAYKFSYDTLSVRSMYSI